jgi:signal transduction histidine kinase
LIKPDPDNEKFPANNVWKTSFNDEETSLQKELAANEEIEQLQATIEKAAARLLIANKELIHQNSEKESRAAELLIANKELVYQNEEKGKRAAELIIANKELLYQNGEKEKRAAELIIANKELLYQNGEKEKRAAELIIANKELLFQNDEKEKRAAELIIANKELVFQHKQKEKQASALIIANQELEQFAYIASHDLQQPLRTIANYMQVLKEDCLDQMGVDGVKYMQAINNATNRMSRLITALLEFSTAGNDKSVSIVDCNLAVKKVLKNMAADISSAHAVITVSAMPTMHLYEREFKMLLTHLLDNAIKFRNGDTVPEIEIKSVESNGEYQFSITDNGIGIAPEHLKKIFQIFQRLHPVADYAGSGIGLAICKKIVEFHKGRIWATSVEGKGSVFHFSIPITR